MSFLVPLPFWVAAEQKGARVEVDISLAFLHWVGIALQPWLFVSYIAIFVLKRDVRLQLTDSLLRAGVQPTLDSSAETFMSVQCASPEMRRGISGCVSKVCPLLGVAYCLAKPGLAFIQQSSPDKHFFGTSQRTLPHLSASAHVSAANTLTLLIKATVTVYRGHHWTLFF